jgi:hypothetical protein
MAVPVPRVRRLGWRYTMSWSIGGWRPGPAQVDCTPSTVSKWRVRYGSDRLSVSARPAIAALSANAVRSMDTASLRCWISHRRGVLHLDGAVAGAGAWGHPRAVYLAVPACPEDRPVGAEIVVSEHRPRLRGQDGRHRWPLLYMSPPDNAVMLSVHEKSSIQALERAQGYLKPPNGRAIIGQSHDYKRNGPRPCLPRSRWRPARSRDSTPPAVEVPRLHEPYGEALSEQRNPRGSRQPVHAQTEPRSMVGAASERAFSPHAHPCIMVEPDRDLVLDPVGQIAERRVVPQRPSTRQLCDPHEADRSARVTEEVTAPASSLARWNRPFRNCRH